MANKDSGGSNFLLCLGLFLVAGCHSLGLTKLKALDKLRGNSTLIHGELRHGRLLIGRNSLQGAKLKGTKATKSSLDDDDDVDYQADMGWWQPEQPKGQNDGYERLKSDDAAVERLLKMEPKVECTGDSMKLQVQNAASTPGSLLFVDRGNRLSPLPLSKLPPSCGYTIRSTRTDLVLVAPYDGCFVTLEEDSYVLPLRWWSLPVRMSCPLMRQSSPDPPMVTCHAEGMVVKMEWTISVAKITVNLNGNWEPLMKASARCGFSVVSHPEGVVISVRYAHCLQKKDGMYTLELAGDGETKISCPLLSPAQPGHTKSTAEGPKPQTETSSKKVYPSTPSHDSASTRAPQPTQKNPAQSAVPQVPDFPQNPEVPNKKPNQGPKDIYQPQLPYFPFNPNVFYPYHANPDAKPTPTVQPTPSPITKKIDGRQSQQTVPPAKLPLNPEGQAPQPLIPLHFYSWPAQPEKVPVEKEPPVQPPTTQEKQPFYLYPFYVKPPIPDSVPPRPEKEPLFSTAPPVVETTLGQRQQSFYPFLIYPQLPQTETPPSEPSVSKPPGELKEPFFPNPSQPPQKPVEPSASQTEGQEYKPLYPLFYPRPSQPPARGGSSVKLTHPLYPEKQLPEQPVPPKPPVSEEPRGQINQPFYLYPFLHQGPYQMPVPPTHQMPTPAPKGQEQQPFSPLQPEVLKPEDSESLLPSEPHPAPESKEPPQPEAPKGHVDQPFYPNRFYPQPENYPAEKPTAVPQPEAPPGQVNQPFYPFYSLYPQPENQPATKPTAHPKAPQTKAPPGQVNQPFYPFYFLYPQPENQPATQPTSHPKAPQPEAPQGQVYQSFYPQQKPENLPAEKPTAVLKPTPTEMPKGPSYLPPFKIPVAGTNGDKAPTEKPVQSQQPPTVKPPESQLSQPFNPYYYPQQPQHPPSVTWPSATSVLQSQQVITQASGQKPPESAIPQPSNGGVALQDPQLGSSYMPPVYCPQFCPSGFSNCCPQIAFHQHLHHIIPAGSGSKDTPPVYPGLSFLPSLTYSGFVNGFGSAAPLQKPIETMGTQAATASTSAPFSPHSLSSGNEKQEHLQPPDGNPALLPGSNPSKPTHIEPPIYPHLAPNLLYQNWPYQQENEEQQNLSPSPAHYSLPSKPQAPDNEQVNPVVQYETYNVQPPTQQNYHPSAEDMNNPPGPNFMSFISQPEKSPDSKGPTQVQREFDHLMAPNYMLQDVQAPTKLALRNNSTHSQPFVSSSKKSPTYEQTANSYSEPKGYVLLQHGPPGRDPHRFSESPLLFRDLVHGPNVPPQNPASHRSRPHSLRSPQEKTQHPKWLGKGITNPLPGNVNYMQRPGDKSESLPLLLSASDGPHFVPLSQDPSFSVERLKPKFFDSFKDFWKPMTPLGSSQRIPPHVPGKTVNGATEQMD